MHAVQTSDPLDSSAHASPESSFTTEDLSSIDVAGFARELDALKAEAYASLGPEDYRHLRKIERWGRVSSFLGYATAWIFPNPLTAFLLSLGNVTRWLLAHHILHRGYDKVPGVPERYTSKGFAAGKRRFLDWFDWFEPPAWDYEHNVLHHYHTGENGDPDLLEEHLRFLRGLPVPRFVKYAFIMLASLTWKATYYAPNTSSVLHPETKKRVRSEHIVWLTLKNIFQFRDRNVRALWLRGYLPYGLVHFAVIPLLFFPLGKTAMLYVLLNKILAEAMANMHSFLVIGPNHTADDLHRFDFHYGSKEQFYVVQVLVSANYRTGTELVDYMSVWLNYQIEHHLFPDLPMLKYRMVQPRVKALCEKYGIPYRQESIFKRFRRMLHVCVGKKDLKSLETFPAVEPGEVAA